GPNTGNNQLAANTSLPAADIVLGQFDFVTGSLNPTASPTTLGALAGPLGVAFDSNSGLYVLDSFSRVLYFTPSSTSLGPVYQNGQSAIRIRSACRARRLPKGFSYLPMLCMFATRRRTESCITIFRQTGRRQPPLH